MPIPGGPTRRIGFVPFFQFVNHSTNNFLDSSLPIKSVKLSFDSGRKAAEATEKASSIGSALNPAAAAIAYAQKFIIEKV